jgi:hypothetical protein
VVGAHIPAKIILNTMAQVTQTEFQAAIQPKTKAQWTQLEYTVPELVRKGDCVQVCDVIFFQ